MTLEQNIIDNILECEVKIGHNSVQFTVYYPNDSLCELLDCDEDNLIDFINKKYINVLELLKCTLVYSKVKEALKTPAKKFKDSYKIIYK